MPITVTLSDAQLAEGQSRAAAIKVDVTTVEANQPSADVHRLHLRLNGLALFVAQAFGLQANYFSGSPGAPDQDSGGTDKVHPS